MAFDEGCLRKQTKAIFKIRSTSSRSSTFLYAVERHPKGKGIMNMQLPRSRMLCAALFSLQLLTAGCASVSPAARQIHMVENTQEVSACTRIGPVSAKSMACVDQSSCVTAAADEGRNQAARMGATHLAKTYSGITLTHGLFEGYAYKCSENQVGVQRVELMNTQTPTSGGCTKDTECKGDRICDRGRCVAPSSSAVPRKE